MIFTEDHARQVLDRSKWQTRRPVRPGEELVSLGFCPDYVWDSKNRRIKWAVGNDYAVQTGRSKKAIGRTPPIEAIRRERLWDISTADCFGEGIYPTYNYWMHPAYSYAGCEADFRTPQEAFRNLWNSIYHKDSNIEVWALEFERIE